MFCSWTRREVDCCPFTSAPAISGPDLGFLPIRKDTTLRYECWEKPTPSPPLGSMRLWTRRCELCSGRSLGAASMAALPQILSRCGALLVPLRTDLNSILTVPRIEAMVSAMRAQGLTVPAPHYIFNAWNEQSPRDQQMRDLVSRQYGERLLPIAIRDSHECEEAIAGRMTVADHSPASEIASDYSSLAAWISDLLPAQPRTAAAQRWVER